MNAYIKDISYYFPTEILTNNDLSKIYDQWDADKIYSKIGIKSRHITSKTETAVDLAEKAALRLFEKNNELKDTIDFIILCTQSPDYTLPTSACILQDKLGISTNCGAFDYNLGCSGFVYGLAIAKGLISTGVAKNILLIMSETYSKHINAMDKSTRTIFGDGAAAVWICESKDGSSLNEFVLGTDGSGAKNLIIPAGGMKLKCSDTTAIEATDEDGNIRSSNNLYMNGTEIFNFTLRKIPKLVEETLDRNNILKEEIDFFIFHQANKYMLDYLRKKLKIPEEKFYINMETSGNTVSATIPIALHQAFEGNLIKKGDKVMLVGFGVGYSWGACVIEI